MKRAERELTMRQGYVRPETPRDRRHRDGLEQDVEQSPLRGSPLRLRLRNFRPSAEGYLASLGGPLPYMARLREIDAMITTILVELEEEWRRLAVECDAQAFGARWRQAASAVGFEEVNDLIERHNRWYPVESRLRMDPRTGDFALVNGKDYRRQLLDEQWVLAHFPPAHDLALGG